MPKLEYTSPPRGALKCWPICHDAVACRLVVKQIAVAYRRIAEQIPDADACWRGVKQFVG